MRYFLLLSVPLLLISNIICSQDLDNPLTLDNEWPGYAIGDPYVLKYSGVFYLYCSTKNNETGVKCWSSRDLVNWDYEGLCTTEAITKTAYAPEVVYWNGTFYMYTSPGGNGHYVLEASEPTGPFNVVTGNLDKSIDGSVFIDDDGDFYFYHASSRGIMGCMMSDPTSIGADINLNAQMNRGWTEGPCVFKRNGTYYMIYTGNHVISKGYRIDYATSTTGPVDQYDPASLQNPILVDALGLHVGLGHGSIFIGPDLDSYFLTYHNLVSGNGPFRRLNFDRIAWNGDKMVLLGPTTFSQQNPELPDAYDYFDRSELGNQWMMPSGGRWYIRDSETLIQDSTSSGGDNWYKAVLDSSTDENYTAEFNFAETRRENNDAKLGALFGYTDEENYGIALLNNYTHQLEINFQVNGSWGTATFLDLPADFDASHWHAIRIIKYLETYRFFLDGMLMHTIANELGAGKIGYLTSWCHGEFSFIAFSNKVNGSGVFDVFKPVPGKLPSVLYNTGGEGTGYHKENPAGQPDPILRTDAVDLVPSLRGGYALAYLETGDWFKYNINVELDRLYNVEIVYSADQDNCKIRLLFNDTDVTGPVDLPSTGGNDQWMSFLVKDVDLKKGFHSLKLEVLEGNLHFYSAEIVKANNTSFDNLVNFDGSFGTGWKYDDGEWKILDKNAVIDGFGKRTYGSDAWCDYTVETDIMFTRSMNAGLIFRVNNPALGGAGNDPALGTDFLQGYFVGFNFGTVVLGKHNYGWESMATAPKSLSMNTWYHLRVVAEGDRIRVFVEDMTQPVIDFIDPDPMINGMAGLRSYNTGVRFDNFHVTSSLLTTSINEDPEPADERQFQIYPNPAGEIATLDFGQAGTRTIRTCDMNGAVLRTQTSDGQRVELITRDLHPGIYVIRVESGKSVITRKLVLQ